MSNQILKERKKYYAALEKTQWGNSDITLWLNWFLNCLKHSLINTETTLNSVLSKAEFWKKFATTSISDRQKLMINKMLDGFKGNLTSSKWAKITKTSSDTALRDIKDLVAKGILQQDEAGGRSVNYKIVC
jgi:Fic family protein